MCKAVSLSSHTLKHVKCLAHANNIAVQNGLKTNGVSKIIANVKRIVGHFHRSSLATSMFEKKPQHLNKVKHALINDVPTRWESTLSMIERFLEQKSVVFEALENLKNDDLIRAFNAIDSELLRKVTTVLEPFQTITTVMSSELLCTLSLIKPLHVTLLEKCETVAEDFQIIKNMKKSDAR